MGCNAGLLLFVVPSIYCSYIAHPCVRCGSDKTMLSRSPIGADAYEAVSYLLVVRPVRSGGGIPLGQCLQAMKFPRVEYGASPDCGPKLNGK